MGYPAIMAPICPNCHHIFEHFEVRTIFEFNELGRPTIKTYGTSPNRCPKCGKEIEGVKCKFPDEDSNGLVFNIDEMYD